MGLFSSKKIISVASTVYNMAGDENDRADFLKGVVFGSVISDSSSISDDINKSYFNGPGMQQRQFFRWADLHNMSGLPTTTVSASVDIDPSIVAGQIPVSPTPAGLNLNIFGAEVNFGDFEAWIEKWILENHPERIGEEWLGNFEPSTGTFSLEFPNNDYFEWLNDTTPIYDPGKKYIVAKYIEVLDNSEDPIVEGTPNVDQLSLPSVAGFTEKSSTGTFTPVTLQRQRTTIYSYNNGDPDETYEDAVDADVAGNLNTSEDVWENEVIISVNGIVVQGERQFWNFTGTDTVTNDYEEVVVTTTDMGGGVIRTETATTTGEQVTPKWTTRYDTQTLYLGDVIGGEQMFIYEVGSGNLVLDSLVQEGDASSFQEFFPFMPLRIDNVSLFDPQYEDLYEEMSRAYRKAYQNNNFGDLIEAVEENESIDDIDYAYLMFGVSLNTKDMSCRKYVYKFFEEMQNFQNGGSTTAMDDLRVLVDEYNEAIQAMIEWQSELNSMNEEHIDWDALPPYPEIPVITPPPNNQIRLNVPDLGFDIRLEWVDIEVETVSGNYASETGGDIPKRDDLQFVIGESFEYEELQTFDGKEGTEVRYVDRSIPSMVIYWQVGDAIYQKMTVWGLVHYNYIYGGKAVVITSNEALEDLEESGFVIPLHYPTMTEMGIVDYTQMVSANAHILFNSYKVTKQRWYERGIFQILTVVLVIVVSVVVFPGAFSTGGGILGSNLAVGAALGLTGTAALVAGVVSNYIASIIISELLKVVGTTILGEKWGSLFAAIAGFSLGAAVSGVKLFSAESLLGMSNAFANGYAGWVQGDIAEIQEELEADRAEYEEQMEYINGLLEELSGNDLNFNPLFLTDIDRRRNGRSGGYIPETSDEFIRRTTMTGSDIVELTHALVYDFADIQRTLPRN